jgi:DNA-directed RNA polymerase subunit RPC12/RpoP
MISVRLHLQGGNVWALCKCSACKTVHKYAIRDAISAPITCKQCGHKMDIRGAVIESVDRMPGAPSSNGSPGGDGSSSPPSTPKRKSRPEDDGQDARCGVI